jgi:hypothetical protein
MSNVKRSSSCSYHLCTIVIYELKPYRSLIYVQVLLYPFVSCDNLFPSSVMRDYKIALHVSALRPSSGAEQVLQDLLLHSAHVQRVLTRLSSG